MSATNVTDNLIDQVITEITNNYASYFSTMNGIGFSLGSLKKITKGNPNPLRWMAPSVYIIPEKTVRDGVLYFITVNILYMLKGQNSKVLAKSIARGTDALAQLIDDKFSVSNIQYEFEYGLSEGNQEAAAQISAEFVI